MTGRCSSKISDGIFEDTSQSGFTLLELMVSIVLIGLIVTVVAGSMRLGYKSVDKGTGRMESLERFRVSLRAMDAQIQSNIPLLSAEEKEGKTHPYIFDGKSTVLTFATNYSLTGGPRGYVIVTYEIVTDENQKQNLSARENVVGMSSGREVKLLYGFDKISFEYFVRNATEENIFEEGNAQENGKWVDEWKEGMVFPEKVRLNLAWGNQSISMIMPLRARPLVAMSTGKAGNKNAKVTSKSGLYA